MLDGRLRDQGSASFSIVQDKVRSSMPSHGVDGFPLVGGSVQRLTETSAEFDSMLAHTHRFSLSSGKVGGSRLAFICGSGMKSGASFRLVRQVQPTPAIILQLLDIGGDLSGDFVLLLLRHLVASLLVSRKSGEEAHILVGVPREGRAARFWCDELLNRQVAPDSDPVQLLTTLQEGIDGGLLIRSLDSVLGTCSLESDCAPLRFSLRDGSLGLPFCSEGVRVEMIRMPITSAWTQAVVNDAIRGSFSVDVNETAISCALRDACGGEATCRLNKESFNGEWQSIGSTVHVDLEPSEVPDGGVGRQEVDPNSALGKQGVQYVIHSRCDIADVLTAADSCVESITLSSAMQHGKDRRSSLNALWEGVRDWIGNSNREEIQEIIIAAEDDESATILRHILRGAPDFDDEKLKGDWTRLLKAVVSATKVSDENGEHGRSPLDKATAVSN